MNKKSTLNKLLSRFKNSLPGVAILAMGLLSANEGMAQRYAMKGWGDARPVVNLGGFGSIGNGGDTIQYRALDVYTDTGWGGKFVQVSAGYTHSLGIKENGSLWGWGRNDMSQLGIPAITTQALSPMVIDSGKNGKWRLASAAGSHSLALKEDSTLWAWGRNAESQFGNNLLTTWTVPTKLTDTVKWTTVTAWGFFIGGWFGNTYYGGGLGIKADGTLWCWGTNSYNTVGDGSNTTVNATVPKNIASGKFLKVAVGYQGHAFAIRADSTLWGWGWNSEGQVGNGGYGTNIVSPTQIGFSDKWIDISPGMTHTMAIKSDGTLWGWGANSYYRVDSSGTTSRLPKKVEDPTTGRWARVYAGYDYTYAVKENGIIYRWGNNGYGLLGDGNPNNLNVYTQKTMLKFHDSLATLAGFSMSTRQYQVLISGIWKTQCVSIKPVIKSVAANAVISWPRGGAGAGYEVVIDMNNGLSPTGIPVATTDTFYNSGNTLTAFQKHYVHVRKNCGFGNYSAWDTAQFVAPFSCRAPKSIGTVIVGTDSATLNWRKADSVVKYEVVVDQSATLVPTGTTAQTTDTFYKTGHTLAPAQTYYAHVRTMCTSTGNSDWDTLSFTTLPMCAVPSNFKADNVSQEAAMLIWNPGVLSQDYEIAIDQSATLAPTAVATQTTDTFYYTGTTLSPNTQYYAHLRLDCGNNNTSAWDTVAFHTPPTAGVVNHNGTATSVVVYPNPVANRLYVRSQVALSASIFSTDGKAMIDAASTVNGVDVSKLAAGLYFVQLKNEEGIIVKTVRFTKVAVQ